MNSQTMELAMLASKYLEPSTIHHIYATENKRVQNELKKANARLWKHPMNIAFLKKNGRERH